MTKNSVFKLRNRRAVRLADTCWLSESKGTLKPHSRTCSYLIKQRPSSAACRPSTDTFTRLSAFFTFFCHSLRTSHWLNIQPPPRGSLSPSPSQSIPIKVTSRPYQINTKKKTLRFTASGRSQVPHVSWFLIIPQIQNSKNPFLGSNDRSQSKGIGACSIHNNQPRDLNLRSSDEHDPLTTLGSPPHTLSLLIVQETL